MRQHTSAHVSICQHTSAYVSMRHYFLGDPSGAWMRSTRRKKSHTSTCVIVLTHAVAAECSVTSIMRAYVSIRQHTSAYVSMRYQKRCRSFVLKQIRKGASSIFFCKDHSPKKLLQWRTNATAHFAWTISRIHLRRGLRATSETVSKIKVNRKFSPTFL
jgi:hypothetical protein